MKYIKNNLLFLVLISQPLLDVLAYFQAESSFSIAGYIRLVYTIGIPVYVLATTSKKKSFLSIMTIIGGICLLHILNGFRVGYIDVISDIKYMLLVVHMPILLFSFIHLYEKEENVRQINKAIKINIIVVMVVFYVTYIMKSGNYTYIDLQQGWTGWYQIPNAQSVIMISLIPFAIYLILQSTGRGCTLFIFPLIFMCLKNGTRTAYYGLILILIGNLVFIIAQHFINRKEKVSFYKTIMLVAAIIITICSYNYTPRKIIDTNEESARTEEQKDLEQYEKLGEGSARTEEQKDLEKYEEVGEVNYLEYLDEDLVARFGEERVLDAYGENVSSYTFADMRLKKRIYGKFVWEDSDFITKLVGFEYPQMQYEGGNFDLENDPHAILYYYGYLGAGLYIALIAYYLIRVLKQVLIDFKQSFNLYNFMIVMTWILQLGLSVYTGYLLRRPNVSIYLMAIMLLIHCRTNSIRKGSAK